MFKKGIVGTFVLTVLATLAFKNSWDSYGSSIVVQSEAEETLYDPFVVLELFTSQGCSSCPAADILLQKVKHENPDRVFTLSYHIDYWNYIGWNDPFSKAEHTLRQSDYNRKLGYHGNYTPEIVVNGKEHFVGSDVSKMNWVLETFRNEKTTNAITITDVRTKDGRISYCYEVKGPFENKKVRAVIVLDQRITEVKRGENRNRRVTNSNIVVHERLSQLARPVGTAFIKLPRIVQKNEKIFLVVLVENEEKDITAAAQIDLKI
ncbi:DUF1223 domain-containing protein [Flavobacteriaceae bacterium TP-CH-4]|uniref:DUF1223 domain-containing protein n=1 Tax=Pelagihabitans pacificus TaxID=2696054 RepID=A0A967AXS5_9FLAO|nr:DUF1223 domain-containing protein [Pelagihabitans pacificus]NHF61108.1 DUF1223 domain-containing protein [Pelagihabitans pacificus]